MVPIFLPQLEVPHAVLEEERAIIREEGWYHVAGRYIASAPDADKARRIEAEQRVAERERCERLTCAWCLERITGHVAVVIAMRAVHPACAKEFDAWISEHPRENDPRWSGVTGSSPVDFNGEMTTWGALALQDRKVVELLPDGRLVGGYPL
jgi:hypothetical protein